MSKKLGGYYYVFTGFIRQSNEGISPFNFQMVTHNLIRTDKDYQAVRSFIIKHLKVMDAFIFNIVILQSTMTEGDFLAFVAEEIANERECSPPHEK